MVNFKFVFNLASCVAARTTEIQGCCQVCRAGCQACAEVLLSLGKAMEAEVETSFLFLLIFSVGTSSYFFLEETFFFFSILASQVL